VVNFKPPIPISIPIQKKSPSILMSQTKTLQEVILSRNPGALSYVYSSGDDYLFVDSVKKNSAGENVFVHRHFDINRIPLQEMTAEQFFNTFKNYSVNTRGLFGGRAKRTRRVGFGKKRKIGKRKTQKRK
jgi:hypothetical protein